jgi:molybdenum cofactor biosynthesis enzyme MoaA
MNADVQVEGFYPREHDNDGPFFWTKPNFSFQRPLKKRYLALYLAPEAPDSRLTLSNHTSIASSISLTAGWHWYSFELPGIEERKVKFAVNAPTVANGSERRGVMVRSIDWHDNSQKHSRIENARANAILNEEEYRSGAPIVRSVPPYLRLTMEVRCNIANDKPCVYCAWKWMKNAEIGSPVSDLSFIKSLEPYLSLAEVVNDSSYGEPPLHPEFAQIVDVIAKDGRAFSFASNGTTLRRKVRRALLGRNVFLYVSIDSACSAGFARYRDDSFDRIVADLRILCREKKSHRNLPHVTVSFIVMNSNKHEISDLLTLMRSIGVDRVKLMSLGREHCMDLDGRVQRRGTFTFNYEEEIIGIDELNSIGRNAYAAAQKIGVELYLDWQDFGIHHGSHGEQPLCKEPWKSLYVLNRGIFPCCFGRKPLAHWNDRGQRSVRQFIEDTFNGEAFQKIRRSLAGGTFPPYCLSTLSCPIVRSATADGARNAPAKETE